MNGIHTCIPFKDTSLSLSFGLDYNFGGEAWALGLLRDKFGTAGADNVAKEQVFPKDVELLEDKAFFIYLYKLRDKLISHFFARRVGGGPVVKKLWI